jgi:hypothetical protein
VKKSSVATSACPSGSAPPRHRPGVGGDEHVGAELGEGERAEDRLEIRRPELAPAPAPWLKLVSRRCSTI